MKVRKTSEPGVRRYSCPFCGRGVLLDDAALSVHHEQPWCDGLSEKLAAFGLKPVPVEPAVWIDDGEGVGKERLS